VQKRILFNCEIGYSPKTLSSQEAGLLVGIAEKFKVKKVTPNNFKSLFSSEQQKLIAEHYNELTPPKQIPYEISKLVDIANSESFKKMHPVQCAAILGHRLVCIHPFDNANGSMSHFPHSKLICLLLTCKKIKQNKKNIGTQQLLMSLELMRKGYPPYVHHEMNSYYEYLQRDIYARDIDPNCKVFFYSNLHLSPTFSFDFKVFTRWCAVNLALTMISSDASNEQLHSYAESIHSLH
jgi:Fic/DOC family